jgi:hypothetical protein
MDLYGRLEELQGMTHLLIDDVTLLLPLVGSLDPDPSDAMKAHRRFYVRAVFALIEGFAEQHRRLLIELADAGFITIREAKLKELREIKDVLDDAGVVVGQREKYLQIFDKIKAVYKAAGEGFGEELKVRLGDDGWRTFKDAMELRNQVTHPKKVEDCWIFETQLQTVTAAGEWFKTLQNEFVRVARRTVSNTTGKRRSRE